MTTLHKIRNLYQKWHNGKMSDYAFLQELKKLFSPKEHIGESNEMIIKSKPECKGQHYFEMLNLLTGDSGDGREQRAYVICRKCGEIRVTKVKSL